MKCKYCEINDAIKYSKYTSGEFCSKVCANSYSSNIRREEKNKKISQALTGKVLSKEHKLKCGRFWTIEEKNKLSVKIKNYYENNPLAKKNISEFLKTRPVKDETRKKLSDAIKKRIADGKHHGWSKRNKPSYPELFFMNVLKNNNIEYNFELSIGKYFIDFALAGKIALEIDGRQHKQLERKIKDDEKDLFLTENGWYVYRIAWKNINTISGKEYISNEIKKLIKYYNKIN
jgi:very-short-patch-repair endonuclease